MKYDIILNNKEVEKILNLKFDNLEEAFQKLKQEFKDFDLENSKKSQFIFENVLCISGKIENNPKDLRCPNCNGRYVANTYAGDLYYRLIMRNRRTERNRKRKICKNGIIL